MLHVTEMKFSPVWNFKPMWNFLWYTQENFCDSVATENVNSVGYFFVGLGIYLKIQANIIPAADFYNSYSGKIQPKKIRLVIWSISACDFLQLWISLSGAGNHEIPSYGYFHFTPPEIGNYGPGKRLGNLIRSTSQFSLWFGVFRLGIFAIVKFHYQEPETMKSQATDIFILHPRKLEITAPEKGLGI